MLTRWVVAAMRVVTNHSILTFFVYFLCEQQFVSTLLSLLSASKVVSELRIYNFTTFRIIIFFVLVFRKTSNYQKTMKTSLLVLLECLGETILLYLSWSLRKLTLNCGFELDQILNFMPQLLCYVSTCGKVVSKQLLLALLLVFIPRYCFFSSIFNFQPALSLQYFRQFTSTNAENTELQNLQI